MLRTSCAIRSCFTFADSRPLLRLANSPFLRRRQNALRIQQFSTFPRLAQESAATASGDTVVPSESHNIGTEASSREEYGGTGPNAAHGRRTPAGRNGPVNSDAKRDADGKPDSAVAKAPSSLKAVHDTATGTTRPAAAQPSVRSPPATSHPTRKYMDPQIRERKKAKRRERREQERKDIADGKIPDPKHARSADKVVDNKEKPAWLVQKEALKRKFGDEGWKPRKKLSPDVIEGIRALNESAPETFTTRLLAQEFAVSPEAIRRILKSKFRATPEEAEDRRRRWEKRGMQVWQRYAEEQGIKPPKKWRILGVGRAARPGLPPIWKKRQNELDRPTARAGRDVGNGAGNGK